MTYTLEIIVLFYAYQYLEVSVETIVLALVALAFNGNNHIVVNTCRNVDFNEFLAFHDSVATAFLTFVLDDSSLTATLCTGSLSLHHAEHAAHRL